MRENLTFSQQGPHTTAFFKERLGQWHTIPFDRTPHYALAQEFAAGRCTLDLTCEYANYLQASWQTKEAGKLEAQLKRFLSLFNEIKHDQQKKPIEVYPRPDGLWGVIDGNHRLAICLALKRQPAVVEVSPAAYLNQILAGARDASFGPNAEGTPYQTIMWPNAAGQLTTAIQGRRTDLLERQALLTPSDLDQSVVLDLGCNVGISTYLAAPRAARAIGVESIPSMLLGAVRLNNFWRCNNVEFLCLDLKKEDAPAADTILAFAVQAHIGRERLIELLRPCRVAYVESHAGQTLADYSEIEKRAKRVDVLRRTLVARETQARTLWRFQLQ